MVSNFMNMYSQFMQNPIQMLCKRYNIPQNVDVKNPNDIIQHLLNSGQVSQAQVNQIMQMKNSPMIQQLMKK